MSKSGVNNFSTFSLVLTLLGAFILLFIIAPLLGMIVNTPFKDVAATTADSQVLSSIWLSIWVAMLTSILFAFPAIPLAYILARYDFPFKSVINGIIDLPVVIPHSVVGIALLGLIAGDGLVGKSLDVFGVRLIGTPFAIALAMAFVSLPFLINSARDGFIQVPVRLEQAALSLGATPFQVFFTISLPLAWRNILSGLVMMFARGMSEFGAVVIVAYHPMVASVMIYDRFTAFGLKYSRPAAFIFLVVSLIVFILLRFISRKR
ncbi:MAG: ABC transporter permease [Tenuifilum sp.]|uniref:ABC transporter permease n=1 Tax=Tenuifilum sp. TaxID=2760880 RepID=UPI001B4DD2A7|nr:ABC transporter permease [Bacteroidales bacterium]HOK87114.1 ABC transporter permease [Tenuifilum sp.]MBP9030450.1 ABC transporter permease [Bacteroidales bacterium]HON71623.1 ABC transporter permease [Tenuifilum sp.]HOU75320.1 ABC transporter permease [Tenuifilum sp.]